jgi:hypothetical protein
MTSRPNDQLGDWLLELEGIELEVHRNLAPLTDAQFNWRPGAGRWSVGECLDHLALTTSLMLAQVRPAVERAKAEGKMGGPGPYPYGLIGGWFVRTMETPGKRPMPAPKNFVPASGLPRSAVLGKFAGAMQEFRETLESARGLALGRVKARSSAQGGGWIRLNLAAWFAASLAHGRRHLAQAERVTKAAGFR